MLKAADSNGPLRLRWHARPPRLLRVSPLLSHFARPGLPPALTLFFLLPFPLLFRLILVVALILPLGMAVVPYSVQFNYDKHLTGAMVNLSIVASFAIMWVILALVPIL